MKGGKIGVGFFGFGLIGKVHAWGYANLPYFFDPVPLETELVGVCTSRRETAEKARAVAPFGLATTDWRELVADPRIDILHCCAPNALHAEFLLRAIEAGKHVYCDKPLCMNVSEARRIVAAARSKPGTRQMTFQYRFLPATIRMKQMVSGGDIGEVRSFRAMYLHSGYVDPSRPISWRLDAKSSGGGALFDLGSHILDLVRWLLGDVEEVMGRTETFVRERPMPGGKGMGKVEVDDAVFALIRMKSGAIGTMEASRIASGSQDDLRIELHGSKGALRFSLQEPNWLYFYDMSAQGSPHGGKRGYTQIECVQRYDRAPEFPGPKFSIGWMRAHMECLAAFLKAVAEGRDGSPSLEDGAAVHAIMEAIYDSARNRTWERPQNV